MSEVITAIYEKGILRPLHPLNLREQQRVYLQVLPVEPVDEAEEAASLNLKPQVLAALDSTGLVTLPKSVALSQARVRHTPIEVSGQPASKVIIEERRGRL